MQTSLHFSAPDLSAGLPAALVGPAPASTAGCDSLRVPKMEQPSRGGLRGLSCLRRGSGDLQGDIPSTFQEKKNVSGSRQRSSASRDGFPGSRGHSELVLIAVQDPRALRQKLKQEDKKQKPVSVLSRAQGGESGLPPLSKHTQGLVVTVLWG